MPEINNELLIRLDQKVQDLSERVERGFREIKDSVIVRLDNLEKDKADRKELEELQIRVNKDIETRVRKLEEDKSRYFIMMSLYTAVGVSMIGLIIWHIFQS